MRIGDVWAPPIPFFERLTKAALLDLLTAEGGRAAAENYAELKKSELAVATFERLPSD